MSESMTNHLLKRGSRYYIRRKIPIDLQAHYEGRKEIVKALGTSDPTDARKLVREESVRLDREFDSIRAATATPAPAPQQVPELVTDPDTGESLWTGKWLTYTPPPQRKNGDASPFEMPEERGYEIDAAAAARSTREATRKVKEARRFHATAYALRAAGIVPAVPPRTHQHAAAPDIATIRKHQATSGGSTGHLAALVEQWAKERKPDARTVAIANRIILRFYERVGRIPVASITRAHVIDFKNKLLESGQTAVNTDRHLSVLRILLNFAVANLQASSNVAQGIKVGERKNAKATRLPFDVPALNAIFSSPVYAHEERPAGGAGEAAYWLPLLALFTGARVEELCQLRPEDVYEETYHAEDDTERSCWVLRVTNEGENQGVKNEYSVRRFPIHAELIKRGFIEYAQAQKSNPRIFHRLKPDATGTESGCWVKWFGRYLRGVCKVTDRKMVFHSFRHGYKDMCRHAGIPEDISDALSGHSSSKVSRRYGGLSYPLAPLVAAVAKIRVPGVKLPQ
ncbi:site-specific integrase [Paraburkholderia aspalathi]|uniref:DUF6538 domain-containing protein n=1 Tax=Paraburkholderia aspalathi TaxID=1324617 RepID=UPI0038B8CBAE